MINSFKIAVIISILSTISSCSRATQNSSDLGLFDISKNDQYILFSIYSRQNSSIYQIGTDGSGLTCIIPSTKDSNYFNPKYSKTVTKILFLACPKKDINNTAIYISNLDGSQKQKITTGNENISEAFFSECEDKIYYCKANDYGHSSPLGTDQNHDVDIYSISLRDKKVERVTNLKSYGIFAISEYDCRHILMFVPVPNQEGMTLVSKDSSTLTVIDPVNNPKDDFGLYYNPKYSQKYNMLAFSAPHLLYIMSMANRNAKLVVNNVDHPNLADFRFFNNQEKIIYTNEDENTFYIVDFNGAMMKTILIKIK